MRRHNVIAIRASSLRSLANACEGLYPVAVADELRAAADTSTSGKACVATEA